MLPGGMAPEVCEWSLCAGVVKHRRVSELQPDREATEVTKGSFFRF